MSTNVLYHAFEVRGHCYVRTDYAQGEVTFTIEQPGLVELPGRPVRIEGQETHSA